MTSRLQEAITVCSANPFGVSTEALGRARNTLRAAPVAAYVAARLKAGDITAADLALISLGHIQACNDPDAPGKVLQDAVLVGRGAPQWPRERSVYLRVVMAAGRCFRALGAIQGTSRAVAELRRQTWSACFGESLAHALDRERVVRDHDVLILGETGTGKEVVATAIQEGTAGTLDGKPAPRAALNAAAIPDNLIESELFGHVRGAFTGAARDRPGRLRSASGGCFFLDEVGDLPLTAQVKLLRVMETDRVDPVGSDIGHPVDVRYVAATHRDLTEMVQEGAFRRDLYQRLAGIIIAIPPLRQRPEDIVGIGLAFVKSYLENDPEVLRNVERWLGSREARTHPWPGNVRELQNALRSLMLGLPPKLGATVAPLGEKTGTVEVPSTIREATAPWRTVSEWYVRTVLQRVDFNYAKAARILALDRATVRRYATPVTRPRRHP